MDKVQKLGGFYCHRILPLVYDDSLSYLELNCKVVAKINEVIDTVDNLSIEVLDEAKRYTDSAIANQQAEIDRKVEELQSLINDTVVIFDGKIAELQNNYNQCYQQVNNLLTIFEGRIVNLDNKIDDSVAAVNARTDLLIERNNEYIFDVVGKHITRDIKVVNMFTGERVTIQDMFNYLGGLHTDNGMTINYAVGKEKTINEMIAVDEDITSWIINGRTLIG